MVSLNSFEEVTWKNGSLLKTSLTQASKPGCFPKQGPSLLSNPQRNDKNTCCTDFLNFP